MRRYDYAVFSGDRFVTNAMLTTKQAAEMEARGYRCIRVRDTVGEGLPSFRGGIRRSGYVARRPLNQGRWDR